MTAAAWDTLHAQRPWGAWPPEAIVRSVCRPWPTAKRADTHVLELGCGSGAITRMLCEEGFLTTAMDWSLQAMARMIGKAATWDHAPDTIVGDFCDAIPLPDSSVDHVIDGVALSCNSLHNMSRAIAHCRRVLKPDGLMTALLFSDACDLGDAADTMRGQDIRYITQDHVRTLFADFGTLEINRVGYTLRNGRDKVQLWHVDAGNP